MKRLFAVWLLLAALLCTACVAGEETAESTEPLPDLLQYQTFVYDELEDGSGSALYTLCLAEDCYTLYRDGGAGIIASGTVSVSDDKSMTFSDGDAFFAGHYTGSAFESPSVTADYGGKTMCFEPAGESGEYVYQSYLGVYAAENQDKSTILILERWFEFYLYTDKTLLRGSYEIYADGSIKLQTVDGESFDGTVEKSDPETFDMQTDALMLDISAGGIAQTGVRFTCAEKLASYQAAHAMGEYTLSLYDADVFAIHGVDGLVKAMGTISMTDQTVTYFPRSITNEIELDARFTIEFTSGEDSLVFPDSTYLLPRSGNIDEATGIGTYWSSGTTLEFLKHAALSADEIIEYPKRETGYSADAIPIVSVLEGDSGLLRQTMPSLGTAKPLVLLIDFPDQLRPRFITAEAVETALFDLADSGSLSAYYYRSSYGNLTIDGTVLDWYRMERNRDEYNSDKEIMQEVLDYYIEEQGLNLADFDSNGDGTVDSLYVLWAGSMDNTKGMWSSAYRSSWNHSPEDWDAAITGYIFVPGTTVWSSVPPLQCNVNALTHETGHLLGLNDYYSYDTTDRTDATEAYTGGALEGGLGGMDMMDVNMGDHNAFSKWLLGWLDPDTVEYTEIAALCESEQSYTLRPSNEYGDALFIKLQPSDTLFTELLVVEVVSPTMNAGEFTRLKEPVVRILHVDATEDAESLVGNWRSYGFRYDNSYTSTKFISTVEADGESRALNYLPTVSGSKLSYDPADYFSEGDRLTSNTWPNTNGYDIYGNATVYNGLCITVDSISETGEAVIRLGWEAKEDVLEITGITPEPVIVPYTEGMLPVMSASTTEIRVTFDRTITANETSRIMVLSGNQKMTAYQVTTEGTDLVVTLDKPLESDRDCTLVIPANVLQSTDDPKITNNFNTILGFITEK